MGRSLYHGAHCCYCKRQLTKAGLERGDSFTWDHVNPKKLGGQKTVPCCRDCNFLKGDLDMDSWFWFIGEHQRWWKTFSHPQQIKAICREEARLRGYRNAGREPPEW